jgi:hypothetical protein
MANVVRKPRVEAPFHNIYENLLEYFFSLKKPSMMMKINVVQFLI